MADTSLMRLGLIGAGRWGRNFIKTIDRIDGMELCAVVDENPETRNFVDGSLIYSDPSDLLNLDLTGVIIAAPPKLHYELSIPFIDNNIPLIIEKPLCLNSDDAVKIKNNAIQNNVLVLVDHTQLYNPAFTKMKEISQQYDKIKYIHAEGMNFGPFRPDVSVLWDWAPHDIAMCLDFLQEPIKSVKAVGDSSHLSIHCESESGVKISILNSNLSSEKRRIFEVYFSEKLLVMNNLAENRISAQDYIIDEDASKFSGFSNEVFHEYEDILPLDNLLLSFKEEIKNKKQNYSSINIAVDVIKVLEAADKSLSQSRVINL